MQADKIAGKTTETKKHPKTAWVFWINLMGFISQFQIIEKNSEQYFVFSVLYALGILYQVKRRHPLDDYFK